MFSQRQLASASQEQDYSRPLQWRGVREDSRSTGITPSPGKSAGKSAGKWTRFLLVFLSALSEAYSAAAVVPVYHSRCCLCVQVSEVGEYVKSLQAVPKSGRHNPLKHPER